MGTRKNVILECGICTSEKGDDSMPIVQRGIQRYSAALRAAPRGVTHAYDLPTNQGVFRAASPTSDAFLTTQGVFERQLSLIQRGSFKYIKVYR